MPNKKPSPYFLKSTGHIVPDIISDPDDICNLLSSPAMCVKVTSQDARRIAAEVIMKALAVDRPLANLIFAMLHSLPVTLDEGVLREQIGRTIGIDTEWPKYRTPLEILVS